MYAAVLGVSCDTLHEYHLKEVGLCELIHLEYRVLIGFGRENLVFNRIPGKSIRAVGGSVELARPHIKIRSYVGPSPRT